MTHCRLDTVYIRNLSCTTFSESNEIAIHCYYLPGRGGRLETALGEGLTSRGFEIAGRATIDEFRDPSFQEQVEVVAQDLTSQYWSGDARVVANSFGAYLFLHAQTLIPPYVGKVLLLSPILGEFTNETTQTSFIPPRSGRFMALARAGEFPVPKHCEVHVGEDDWQSDPKNVVEFTKLLGLSSNVVPAVGHMLRKHYVGDVLDRWLGAP